MCKRTRDGVEEIATAGTQQITCKSLRPSIVINLSGCGYHCHVTLQTLAMVIMFSCSILVPSLSSVAMAIPMSQSTCSVGYRDSFSTRKPQICIKLQSCPPPPPRKPKNLELKNMGGGGGDIGCSKLLVHVLCMIVFAYTV